MIQTIYRFAEGIDELDWEKVRTTLAPIVQLDSTLVGRGMHEFKAQEFIDYMNAASGSFQATCHSVGNFRSLQRGKDIELTFDLMALHYLPGEEGQEVWTLFRTMKATMNLQNGNWVMTSMQTLLEQNAGNTSIMEQLQRNKMPRLPRRPGENADLVNEYFAMLQSKGLDKNIWADNAVLLMPFVSHQPQQLKGKAIIETYYSQYVLPASILWTLKDTQDANISLAAYERIAENGASAVGVTIFFCADGLLQRVEDYCSQ